MKIKCHKETFRNLCRVILIIGDNLEVNTLGTVHRLSGIARGVNHGHSLLPEKLNYPAVLVDYPYHMLFLYYSFHMKIFSFICSHVDNHLLLLASRKNCILLLILIKKVIQDKFVYLFAVHCSLHTQNLINRKINGRYIHVSLVYHCI